MAAQGRQGENRGRPLVEAVCWLRLPYVTAVLALCQGAYSSKTHLEERLDLLEYLQRKWNVPRIEEVCLASGNSTAGRVEVRIGDVWGTVCDDLWDVNEAKVVCRSLGLKGGVALREAAFGPGTGLILLDDVFCIGDEKHFRDCFFLNGTTGNCHHTEDASVVCLSDTRLTASKCEAICPRMDMKPNEGNAKMIHKEATVINLSCEAFMIEVATQQQQITWRWEWAKEASYAYLQKWTEITSGVSLGPVINFPNCSALATNSTLTRSLTLSDDRTQIRCSYFHPSKARYSIEKAKVYSVGHVHQIAIVVNSTRLSDGNATIGRVEVQIHGVWGNVCDNDWDNREAAVVCRSLNLTGGQAISDPKYSTSSLPLLLTNVTCEGLEDDLSLCGQLCRTDACKSRCTKAYVAVVCNTHETKEQTCTDQELEGNVTVTPACNREADREQSQRVSIKCTAILAGVMTIPSKIPWEWEWRGLDKSKNATDVPSKTGGEEEEDQLMTAWAPVNRTDDKTIITSQVAAQITQPCFRLEVSSTLTRTLTLQDHRRKYRCQYQHPTKVDYSLRTAGVFCVGNVHPIINIVATEGKLSVADVLGISLAAVLCLVLLVALLVLALQGRRKEVIIINAPSAMPRGSIRYPMSPRGSTQRPKSPRESIHSTTRESTISTSYVEPTSYATESEQSVVESELYSEV